MLLTLEAIRTDGNTQPRETLDEATVRDYALAMLEGDEFPPLVVFHDGSQYWLAAGFHRLAAAATIGITEFPVIVHQGGPRDAYLFAVEDNRKNGVRYTNADKRAMVDRFLADPEWSVWSNREIARRCGVSHKFVNDLRSLEPGSSEDRAYVTKHGSLATMNTANIGGTRRCPYCELRYTGNDEEITKCPNCNQLHRYSGPRDTERYGPYRRIEADLLPFEPDGAPPSVLTTDYDGDEWYTPATYIEAARSVLGGIDLDPASNDEAQSVVQADRYYSTADNGLTQPWHGRVWLNPPYSMPLIQQFTSRLITAYQDREIDSAIILTNNCTDAAWFHSLMEAYPVCFTRGRVSFWRPDRTVFATRQGQAFFYLGPTPDRFYEVFRQIGAFPNRLGPEVIA